MLVHFIQYSNADVQVCIYAPYFDFLLLLVDFWHFLIHRLQELDQFIEEALVQLNKPLIKGDYDGLVNIMGYLLQIKQRQDETDNLFEPIREVITLLKSYGLDLSDQVYALLGVSVFWGQLRCAFFQFEFGWWATKNRIKFVDVGEYRCRMRRVSESPSSITRLFRTKSWLFNIIY